MTAFINHFLFEFRTGIRNKQLLLLNYLFPLGFYLMMGFIMVDINPPFREVMTPGLVIFAILAATFLGLPDYIVSARESGILRSYRINGIPSLSIMVIPVITTMLHLVIVSAIIVLTAAPLFDAAVPVNWLHFGIIFLTMAFCCASVSLLIGVISSSTRVTVLWSQLFFIPSMLLGGMMVSYDWLPEAAQQFAQLLPATHAMNAMNGLAMGFKASYSPWGSVLALIACGLLAFTLAIYMFSWDRQNTTQRGHPLLAILVLVPFVVGIFVL